MRTENQSVISDFAKVGETKYLKSAGIGKDRARPGHETMQAAQAADSFMARPKIKMIGVAQQNLHAQFAERLLRQPLHRALRADGHERRRVDNSVRSRETTQARARRIGF